jgi:hypothetical protein
VIVLIVDIVPIENKASDILRKTSQIGEFRAQLPAPRPLLKVDFGWRLARIANRTLFGLEDRASFWIGSVINLKHSNQADK